jgi:hypothetical protein
MLHVLVVKDALVLEKTAHVVNLVNAPVVRDVLVEI